MKNKKNKKYDVFISYSRKDMEIARQLYTELTNRGVSVYIDIDCLGVGNFQEQIKQAIIAADIFMPVLTENYASSPHCMAEYDLATRYAKDRSKKIIPVESDTLLENTGGLMLRMDNRSHIIGSLDEKGIENIADKVAQNVKNDNDEKLLYEKLSEYSRVKAKPQMSDVLCDIIEIACQKLKENMPYNQRKEQLFALVELLDKLFYSYNGDYKAFGRERADKKNLTSIEVLNLIKLPFFEEGDLIYDCAAIRIIYYARECRLDAIDVMTHGDVTGEVIHPLPEKDYIEHQRPYMNRYRRATESLAVQELYSEKEREFILATPKFAYERTQPQSAASNSNIMPHSRESISNQTVSPLSKEDELLTSVASFMREGNRIFDMIGERDGAQEFIKCLLTSYERLKAYCEVIGEKNICAECVERIVELRRKLEKSESGKGSEKAESGIKTLLGITVPKSGKYDVFISHKRQDADIAEDMYYFFKKNLKEAFYDRFSLPDMGETQYRRSIMQALDGSTHFVVVFSDVAYLESKWVKLEMDIFLSEMDEGRKENARFLLVATNSAYDEIMRSNKEILPIDYRRFEIIRVEEYKDKILGYIN